MADALQTIDRFFRIITSSQDKNNQRILQEWAYLHNLLKSQPVSHERIEAYLNILQNHDYSARRNINKGKKSLTEHPKAKQLLAVADQIVEMLQTGSGKVRVYQKYD